MKAGGVVEVNKLIEEIVSEVRKQLNGPGASTGGMNEYGKYCDHTVLRAYTPKSIVRRSTQIRVCVGMCQPDLGGIMHPTAQGLTGESLHGNRFPAWGQ